MRFSRRAVLAAPALLYAPPPAVHAMTAPRMVVELFTSQGCSSCPPADKLLVELAASSDILALSWPVDYWDYLGWKDTLARPAHTERQKIYSQLRGDRQVYTPQAVINGLAHCVGSKRSAIEAAAAATRSRNSVLDVAVTLSEEGSDIHCLIKTTKSAPDPRGRVVVLKLRRRVNVAIGRGENSGRTVVYANVVQGFEEVGGINGQETRVTFAKAKTTGPDIDGYAVLVQLGGISEPGAILGAAKGPGI